MKNIKHYEKYLNLREMLADCAERYGDKTYLKYFDENNKIAELSFRELNNKVAAFATYLMSLENSPRRIVIYSENRYEWIISYLAGICGGFVVIPLDKELRFENAADFMRLVNADAVIYSGKSDSDIFAMSCGSDIGTFICFDAFGERDERFCLFSDCLEKGSRLIEGGFDKYARLRTDSSKMCEILFTSGTTGTSKGVMLCEDNIMTCIHAAANMCGINENDVALSVLPFNHTYEATCGILTPLCLGVTVCLNNGLKYVLRNIKLFRPTVMVLVPLFVTKIYRRICDGIEKSNKQKLVAGAVRLTALARKAGIDARRAAFSTIHKELGGRLRTVVCGGAALDPELVKAFDEFGITLLQGYGITECSPLVSVNPIDKIKRTSVGKPIDGTVIRIVGNDKDGCEMNLPVGEIGEICVKGSQVMLGYYGNEAATADAFNGEGFFRTGDYGMLDEDGYVYITGRKKNIIILENGKNVYPEELEEYLSRSELVSECAVVLRTVNGEQLITAVVFPEKSRLDGLDDDGIKARIKSEIVAINKTLPIYKQIRNIEIKKTEFEKTTTKKIIRSAI